MLQMCLLSPSAWNNIPEDSRFHSCWKAVWAIYCVIYVMLQGRNKKLKEITSPGLRSVRHLVPWYCMYTSYYSQGYRLVAVVIWYHVVWKKPSQEFKHLRRMWPRDLWVNLDFLQNMKLKQECFYFLMIWWKFIQIRVNFLYILW
jgi:hypothetical protein